METINNMPCMKMHMANGDLNILSWGELNALELREREYLIMPWLRQGESAMVYAAPGVGKTLFSLSLAVSIAGAGRIINTWNCGGVPRKVLYIDGEMPLDDIRDRIRILLPASEADAQAVDKNLVVLSRQGQPNGDTPFLDFACEETHKAVIKHVIENEIDFVVLDNLPTLATIEDENAASAFNDIVKFLLRIKQAGVACLLVHHCGKSNNKYRGSSKIATTFEVIIRLEEEQTVDADENNATRFKLVWDKYRGKKDKDTGHDLIVSLSAEDDSTWKWMTITDTEGLHKKIFEMVKSCAYEFDKDIADELSISKVALSRERKKMIKAGVISLDEWKRCQASAKQSPAPTATAEEEVDF